MMKKITLLILILLGSFWSYSQCLTSVNGQWPGPDGTPFALNTSNCDGFTVQNVTTCGYASEYSLVTVALGQTYVFRSSIATDVITISTDAGATAAAFGIGTVTWVSTVAGNIRFYTHLDATCAAQSTCRIKSVTCGIVSPDAPDYANLQWPPTASIVQGGSFTVFGQIYEGGLTDVAPNIVGQAPGIQVWVGTSATNTNPNTWTNWTLATWNAVQVSNNDEYQATIGANLTPGTYYYATRIRLNTGAYFYGGINASPPNNGNFWDGATFGSGVLTVTAPPPPANDNCSGALSLTVNPDYLCGSVTAGTVLGATASTQDAAACGGTEDDDVWFAFVATSTTHRISILNAAGSTTDMYHSLWTGADCSSLTLVAGSCSDADISNPTGLTIGTTYYVRVYTWDAIPGANSTFNVCIGTPPPAPTNDNFATPIAVTEMVAVERLCLAIVANTFGNVAKPITEVSSKNPTAKPIVVAMVPMPTEPCSTIRTTMVKMMRPRTSSTTAAPSTVRASTVASARKSPNTRAVIPMLVAVSAAPINKDVLVDSPIERPTPTPSAIGNATPMSATSIEARPTLRSSAMSVSMPT
jgi:hypothetical protein